MKCPKCDYLGFETGDRCKNCGYDFSLMNVPEVEYGELTLETPASDSGPVADLWLEGPAPASSQQATSSAPAPRIEASFPLFMTPGRDDDDPLIKLPTEPRPPLAVRRAPEVSRAARARTAPRFPRTADSGLPLTFAADAPDEVVPTITPASIAGTAVPVGPIHEGDGQIASLGARALAAVIDHAILFGIDLLVVYSTLRMANLTMSDWTALPALPMLAFLILMKLAYFSAFTAMGGQTIGKMAAGIRVVSDDDVRLDPGRAVRRTLTGAVSLGLGLIPALISPDRRTFHDHVAHTRVVDLRSA